MENMHTDVRAEGFRAYKGKIYNGALKSYHILMEVVKG